jgi:hypothetical protein
MNSGRTWREIESACRIVSRSASECRSGLRREIEQSPEAVQTRDFALVPLGFYRGECQLLGVQSLARKLHGHDRGG